MKNNASYHILIKTHHSPIESIAMTRYLAYKYTIFNMEGNKLPMIASNSIHNHLWLKQGWHKDVKSLLNHWGIEEEVTLHNIKTRIASVLQKNVVNIVNFVGCVKIAG